MNKSVQNLVFGLRVQDRHSSNMKLSVKRIQGKNENNKKDPIIRFQINVQTNGLNSFLPTKLLILFNIFSTVLFFTKNFAYYKA